jgi:hypothetical protein
MSQGLMIQCDTCKCWQHGPCVGLWGEKVSPHHLSINICISKLFLGIDRIVLSATFASYADRLGMVQAGELTSCAIVQ